MPLFTKNHFVLWPKDKITEIYSDKKEKNTESFNISLWKKLDSASLQSLATYLKKNNINSCQLLLPPSVAPVKSFLYDGKITSIEKKEVVSLAQNYLSFEVSPDTISYQLVNTDQKTIIRATAYDKQKIDNLNSNLSQLKLKITRLLPSSSALSGIINTFYQQEYFLLYPQETNQYTFILAKGESVYLSTTLKGPTLDIQKIINYSKLYFTDPVKKLFLPHDHKVDIISTSQLDQTPINIAQITQNLNKPSNLPLPVVGIMTSLQSTKPDIIKTVDNNQPSPINTNLAPPPSSAPSKKKNILPIIAVFIFTAAIASVVIWFVLNRKPTSPAEDKVVDNIPTAAPQPTNTPAPTITEIDKDIKLQVLNATEINGQAASLKEELVSLGFTNIAVGNNKETLTTNEIRTTSSSNSISVYFKNKLANIFPATFTTLKDSSIYDAVFVIGTDLRDPDKITPTSVTTSAPDTTPTTTEEATPTTNTTSTPTPTPTDTATPTPTSTPTE